MKRIFVAVLSLSIFLSTAYAHDMKFHKGPMFMGEATAIRPDGLDMKTEKGELKVTYTDQTKFEVGEEGKPAEKGVVKVGDPLMISGHKLETGELVATNVMIHEMQTGADDHHHQK